MFLRLFIYFHSLCTQFPPPVFLWKKCLTKNKFNKYIGCDFFGDVIFRAVSTLCSKYLLLTIVIHYCPTPCRDRKTAGIFMPTVHKKFACEHQIEEPCSVCALAQRDHRRFLPAYFLLEGYPLIWSRGRNCQGFFLL